MIIVAKIDAFDTTWESWDTCERIPRLTRVRCYSDTKGDGINTRARVLALLI